MTSLPDWVVVTTGASEALSVLYCLAAEPGASIVLPNPGFPAFAAMARAWGLEVTTYELERTQGFAQTADLVLAAVDDETRLVRRQLAAQSNGQRHAARGSGPACRVARRARHSIGC
jgi:aspartate/methionine/tyrosine aminotransferase